MLHKYSTCLLANGAQATAHLDRAQVFVAQKMKSFRFCKTYSSMEPSNMRALCAHTVRTPPDRPWYQGWRRFLSPETVVYKKSVSVHRSKTITVIDNGPHRPNTTCTCLNFMCTSAIYRFNVYGGDSIPGSDFKPNKYYRGRICTESPRGDSVEEIL